MSYFDFGQFLTKNEIKLKAWEQDLLLDRLDRL